MENTSLGRRARRMIWIVAIPFVALAGLGAALLAVQVQNGGRQLDFVIIYYAPMALYIWASWLILGMLRAIGRGEIQYTAVPVLLQRIGIALFAGAILTFAGVPILTWLVSGHPYVATFEPSAVMLGMIGAALIVLAQMLREAIEARAELKEFF